MEEKEMRSLLRKLIVPLMLLVPLAAPAQQQSPWADTGINGLFIRFDQVSPTRCAWEFRNGSIRTLAVFNFRIEDFNAETRVPEHSSGQMPTPLNSGQEFGGASAFSADANCRSVKLIVTNVQWQ
jgi:hypothetical protein